MKVKLISFVLVVLSIDNFVLSEKYQYIGDFLLKNEQNQHHVTFVCVSSSHRKNLFDISGTVGCSKQGLHLWKSDINSIDFTECHQPQIPDTLFERYRNVRVFDLSNLGLELLNTNGFGELTKLNASQNELAKISVDTFASANELIEVDLSFNKISELNENAFAVKNKVETLNLAHNDMQVIPVNTFHRLIKLKHLLFSHNQIEAIPSLLFLRSEHLIEIDFSFNKIKIIGDFSFGGDLNLEKVNLSHNQITYFHKMFVENHSKLKYLDISSNQLTTLKADTFGNLSNLEHLDISDNRITVLTDDALKNLRNLELLNLSNNSIENLDNKTFGNLVKLQHLDLSYNKIREIKSGTFSNQTNLKKLDLSSNKLETLHTNSLPSNSNDGLSVLNISNNKIAVLFSNISPSPLNGLQLLSIGNNLLRELNGFTSSFIPNAQIVGIDSNKFNCSYLKMLLPSIITWKHLDTNSIKGIECNSSSSEAELETKTDLDILAVTSEQSSASETSVRAETTSNNVFIRTVESFATTENTGLNQSVISSTQKSRQNENNPISQNHSIDSKIDSIEQYLSKMMCAMAIGFSVIGLVLAWIIFHKRFFKKNETANVFYRQSEPELCNAFGNNQYEVIGFDKK